MKRVILDVAGIGTVIVDIPNHDEPTVVVGKSRTRRVTRVPRLAGPNEFRAAAIAEGEQPRVGANVYRWLALEAERLSLNPSDDGIKISELTRLTRDMIAPGWPNGLSIAGTRWRVICQVIERSKARPA